MDIGIAAIFASLIVSAGGITCTILCVAIPRKRKEQIRSLQKELLEVYKGVLQLKNVESKLEEQNGITKQKARKGFDIPERFEDSRIRKRIKMIEKQID